MTGRVGEGGAWGLPILLFLGVALTFASTIATDRASVDAHAASVQAWRIATSGSPWLDGIRGEPLVANNPFIGEAPNGHVVAQRMGGPVLVGVPGYWILHRDPHPAQFSLAPAGLAAATVTALTIMFVFLAARRHVGSAVALGGGLVLALATPTWSVSANALWTHTITQFGLAGAAYAASRNRWWLAGVLFGVGMFGRPHIAVVAAVVGLGVAWSRRDARVASAVGVPTVLALGILAVWNRWMFGKWSIGGAYQGHAERAVGGQDSQWLNYLGFLVSPDRGFLIWTPVVLILAPTVVRQWSQLPMWSRLLAIGGVVYTVAQLRLNHFGGGDAFYGYRHGLELLICLAPIMIHVWPELRPLTRHIVAGVCTAQFAAITIGAVTESFLLPLAAVWTDNSLWFALREQPVVIGTWLALCIACGVAVSVAAGRDRRLPPRTSRHPDRR